MVRIDNAHVRPEDKTNPSRDCWRRPGGLAALAPSALVMHPGPIIRGLELTAGVADGRQSAILEQVRHGVAIRMAVVERALTATGKAGRA